MPSVVELTTVAVITQYTSFMEPANQQHLIFAKFMRVKAAAWSSTETEHTEQAADITTLAKAAKTKLLVPWKNKGGHSTSQTLPSAQKWLSYNRKFRS